MKQNNSANNRICPVCWKVFKGRPTYIRQGLARFCSWDCLYESMRTRKEITRKCLYCSNTFTFKASPLELKKHPRKFCSKKCNAKARKGNIAANWRNGATLLNQIIRTSTPFKIWREAVFKRDQYTCFFCGAYGKYLNAHHLKPFAKFPELRFAIDNGITVCKTCHYKIHSKQ